LYTDNNHKRNLKVIKVEILDRGEEIKMKKFERLIIYPLLLVTRGKQMKNIAIVVALVLLAGVLATQAQETTWETVSIPGLCTFQIPPTVEIQKGTYKLITDQFQKMILEIDKSPDCVVVQPKGINDFDPVALKKYCRIIVETERGTKGDYAKLDEPLLVSEAELKEFDKEFWNQVEQQAAAMYAKGVKMTILSWQPIKITRVNGVDALLITYTRSTNDAPSVLVQVYMMIQNNDVMHTIAISYRESEKDIWADDLGRVINTFKFEKR
jgi:hypothetical protein